MIRLALAGSFVLALAACGQSNVPKDAQATADALTGDAKGQASDNPLCKLFTPAEAAAYIGEPLVAGENAAMGTGCQWVAKDGEGDVMVVAVPGRYEERPTLGEGFKEVAGVGERGFVIPELGGFSAGAVVGQEFVKVSVSGTSASADQAVALLKETIKRRS